jgi:hypothetical protein
MEIQQHVRPYDVLFRISRNFNMPKLPLDLLEFHLSGEASPRQAFKVHSHADILTLVHV